MLAIERIAKAAGEINRKKKAEGGRRGGRRPFYVLR
jgi:hypothetical protein